MSTTPAAAMAAVHASMNAPAAAAPSELRRRWVGPAPSDVDKELEGLVALGLRAAEARLDVPAVAMVLRCRARPRAAATLIRVRHRPDFENEGTATGPAKRHEEGRTQRQPTRKHVGHRQRAIGGTAAGQRGGDDLSRPASAARAPSGLSDQRRAELTRRAEALTLGQGPLLRVLAARVWGAARSHH